MVVDIGNSTANAASPNAPPTAPEAAAANLCKRSLDATLPSMP